jgi:hypothetical protein
VYALLVTSDTCPASLVTLAILAQTRELAERETIVGAALAAAAFVFMEAGWASSEICMTQPRKMEKPILFIKVLGEWRTADELAGPG